MELQDLNPWWKTGSIPKEYKEMERREMFKEIVKYIDDRQIISIVGLRRVGKTVLLHHIIDLLLERTKKENILYYTYDLFEDKNIKEILDMYASFVDVDIKKDKVFIFLDEVQKHKGWEKEIKILYDTYRNIKFFISGSNSLFIEKKTKESLAGRVYSFELNSPSFLEYLRLKKISYGYELYRRELEEELNLYMKTGGFPELMYEKDDSKIKKYIKELIVDRIAYIDIPSVFDVEEPELLIVLISIISNNPGMLFDYDTIASDLKRNRKTISNYIFYLEKAFLIKKLYNFSKSRITSEKKLKKIYPSTSALAFLYSAETGRMIETLFLQNCRSTFFYRKQDKEVDFVDKFPIEIKYQENITKQDLKSMKYFMKLFNFNEGLIITKTLEKSLKFDNKKISFVPLLKYLMRL
jgi:predicted AAA+ superfamily ATPase